MYVYYGFAVVESTLWFRTVLSSRRESEYCCVGIAVLPGVGVEAFMGQFGDGKSSRDRDDFPPAGLYTLTLRLSPLMSKFKSGSPQRGKFRNKERKIALCFAVLVCLYATSEAGTKKIRAFCMSGNVGEDISSSVDVLAKVSHIDDTWISTFLTSLWVRIRLLHIGLEPTNQDGCNPLDIRALGYIAHGHHHPSFIVS